jgi:UDP-N-acetylglucosamine 2-epimerase (non-hydrolysing)
MKAAPVVAALADLEVPQLLVHTGQHYDANLSDVFFDQLGLPQPDISLGVGSGSHGEQTAALLAALEQTFIDHAPSLVVVYGDVNSTVAAALAAAKLGVPTAHVESGLRSFDRSMPEEINRVVTDAICDVHFVTCPEGLVHLGNEGADPASVHFVGNPMIDTLERFRPLLDPESVRTRWNLPADYGVVTLHHPSNVDDPQRVRRLVEVLEAVSRNSLPLLFPVHPRGQTAFELAGLHNSERVVVTAPLPYVEFMSAVSGARAVVTDSGGIQEETTVLGVPCLTLRDNTERPITILEGTNQLVGSDPAKLPEAIATALERRPEPRQPALWDGQAGRRIADIVARIVGFDARSDEMRSS